MARVAEANTSTYIQGSVDYYAYVSGSNIIVDVYFQMRRTNAYSGDTHSPTAVPNICISGNPTNFNYTGSPDIRVAGGQQDVWQTIFTASRTFDSSRSGQTTYVGWKVTDDNSGYLGGSAVAAITLPVVVPTPSITGLTVTSDSTSVGWFVDDGVGSLNGTGYLYGGTSPSPTTQIATTTLKNDTFVNTGLTPNTTYYYRGRIKDPNNNWGGYTPDLTLTTSQANQKFYGSVNGEAKEIVKLYGPSLELAGINASLYGNNGPIRTININTFTSRFLHDYPDYKLYDYGSPTRIIVFSVDSSYTLRIETSREVIALTNLTQTQLSNSWGITVSLSNSYRSGAELYPTYSYRAREVKKLYGSVNGQAKRIL